MTMPRASPQKINHAPLPLVHTSERAYRKVWDVPWWQCPRGTHSVQGGSWFTMKRRKRRLKLWRWGVSGRKWILWRSRTQSSWHSQSLNSWGIHQHLTLWPFLSLVSMTTLHSASLLSCPQPLLLFSAYAFLKCQCSVPFPSGSHSLIWLPNDSEICFQFLTSSIPPGYLKGTSKLKWPKLSSFSSSKNNHNDKL